jgi:hypothetical protein
MTWSLGRGIAIAIVSSEMLMVSTRQTAFAAPDENSESSVVIAVTRGTLRSRFSTSRSFDGRISGRFRGRAKNRLHCRRTDCGHEAEIPDWIQEKLLVFSAKMAMVSTAHEWQVAGLNNFAG